MTGSIVEWGGRRVFLLDADGPTIGGDRGAADLIGEVYGSDARVVAIPLSRLGDDFLRLSTGVAGDLLQKLINYRFRVAILGDVSAAVAASAALRDLVIESNRGEMVWFLPDLAALEARLTGQSA